MSPTTLCIKVDVDTFDGARYGVPRLLALFDELHVGATFFLSHGPDNSGKAIWNVLRQRGFLAKMLRTRALRLYGLRTALSGTLLPARFASRSLRDTLRRIPDAGHEVGVHGWDHRRWQDALPRVSREWIRAELERALASHEETFGAAPQGFGAPGWRIDGRSIEELESAGFVYSSSTRYGEPFAPLVDAAEGQRRASIVEIPSTTACPEELVGTGAALFPRLEDAACVVYPAHAEIEGGPYLDRFRDWFVDVLASDVRVTTLGGLARALLERPASLPGRALETTALPGRAGEVTTGWPELCAGRVGRET